MTQQVLINGSTLLAQRTAINANFTEVYGLIAGIGTGTGGSTTLAALTDIASYDLADNNTSLAAVKTTANAAIPSTQKGAANGVASLDGTGKVPAAQLPATSTTLASLTDIASYDLADNNTSLAAVKATAAAALPAAQKNAASGVAPLDASSLLPVANLPNVPVANLPNVPVAKLNSGTGASATTFWRGDGTWATPPGTGTVTSVGLSAAGTYAGAITVGSSPVTGSGSITVTPNLFTATAPGVVPLSGGGTTNFLRADGTWAAPPTGGTIDATPTSGSANAVSSGGVYTALATKASAATIAGGTLATGNIGSSMDNTTQTAAASATLTMTAGMSTPTGFVIDANATTGFTIAWGSTFSINGGSAAAGSLSVPAGGFAVFRQKAGTDSYYIATGPGTDLVPARTESSTLTLAATDLGGTSITAAACAVTVGTQAVGFWRNFEGAGVVTFTGSGVTVTDDRQSTGTTYPMCQIYFPTSTTAAVIRGTKT